MDSCSTYFCFPINIRLKLQKQLEHCFQDDKPVSEFVYELKELFLMIVIMDECKKVMKLWFGLLPIIQKHLWKNRLHPKISEWDDVVKAAQIIEIAENVADQL